MIHLLHPRLPECIAVWTAFGVWMIHYHKRRSNAPLKSRHKDMAVTKEEALMRQAGEQATKEGKRPPPLQLTAAKLKTLHQLILDKAMELEDQKGDGNPESLLLYDVARQIKTRV